MCKADDIRHQPLLFGVVLDAADEGTVDLHIIRHHQQQTGGVGVACPVVVNGKLAPQGGTPCLQRVHQVAVHIALLRDLDHDIFQKLPVGGLEQVKVRFRQQMIRDPVDEQLLVGKRLLMLGEGVHGVEQGGMLHRIQPLVLLGDPQDLGGGQRQIPCAH